jgi:hypothetical protein
MPEQPDACAQIRQIGRGPVKGVALGASIQDRVHVRIAVAHDELRGCRLVRPAAHHLLQWWGDSIQVVEIAVADDGEVRPVSYPLHAAIWRASTDHVAEAHKTARPLCDCERFSALECLQVAVYV